ncbi:hypothetical protein V494_04051 [Pseudogymnoascus sp. VKM F-4513 (FW-928)]|nr:hypothetical protein V494_04051 [Pseudogymnoascus sp. VKM F-4513 (FW-928)]
MSAPPRPYVTPYPTPPSIAVATPARAQSSPAPAAPQILVGLDGVKYSSDPTSEFGELLVSANRELVEIEDVEYTRQVVLVGKKAPRPPKAAGPERSGRGASSWRLRMWSIRGR